MRILLVDDSRAMRLLLRRALRLGGLPDLSVSEAPGGAEALEILRREVFDLVITDWHMPLMTGIELIAKLKQEQLPVTVGMITVESTPQMRRIAVGAGAVFMLSKPVSPERLRAELAGMRP